MKILLSFLKPDEPRFKQLKAAIEVQMEKLSAPTVIVSNNSSGIDDLEKLSSP
jgi:hypothetical protein